MDARMQARRSLELDLRKALDADEFELYYQPLVNLSRREVRRLRGAACAGGHPLRGLVPPGEFIPLAEEIGLIRADRRMGASARPACRPRAGRGI